jgi:beta-glucanase (GH16 family)
MKKNILKIVMVLFWVANVVFLYAQPPSGTWTLVAEDNFDSTNLNTEMWGFGSTPWGTENQSSCTLIPAEDTWVSDGSLVLQSRIGGFKGPSGKYFDYTSGWAWQKVGKKYGYIEIRAKYPNHPGAWPAFWMLGDGWPPEFDIAEYKGPTVGGMTMAFYDGSWFATTKQGDYEAWHTYGLLWEPGALTWYMDGEVIFSHKGSTVPTQDMYVVLSNGTNCDISDNTGFPNYVNVDWFRWWQGTADNPRCEKLGIIPYLMIKNIEWIQSTDVTVKPGTSLRFRPEPAGAIGGSYSWSGNGVTSTSKELSVSPTVSGSYTVTYTSTCGSVTTATYNVTIDPNYVYPSTPITPYFIIDEGEWQGSATISVVKGSKVKIAPHPYSGGTWSWSGGGTSGSSREQTIYPTSSTTATATYLNQYGSRSTLTFTINIIIPCAPTAIIPYLQVNGGAWQQTSNITISPGSTVKFGPHPWSGGTWSWSGGGTSGANREQSIKPTSTTTLTATYTNDCYGKSTQTFTITVNGSTDIPQNEFKKKIGLFPNPVKDELHIKFPENFRSKITISIINNVGQVVFRKNSMNSESQTINLSHLISGIYCICIANGDETIQETIIKQ